MFIAAAVVSIFLAVALVISASGKLTKMAAVMEVMTRVGVPEDRVWLLAVAEIAGAAGLLIGLFWWPLGVAAAIGVVAYFIGAVGAHIRVGDQKNVAPPAFLLLVGAVALVLRAVTA
jgi:uncharacterized membrane protein YphA (DoxX/SURF4 family)